MAQRLRGYARNDEWGEMSGGYQVMRRSWGGGLNGRGQTLRANLHIMNLYLLNSFGQSHTWRYLMPTGLTVYPVF